VTLPSEDLRKTSDSRPRTPVTVAPAALPVLPRWYLPRTRLWERLESAADGAVTLVVAPVGAGKTLGVAGWLRHSGRAADALWVASAPDLTIADLDRLTSLRDDDGQPRLLVLDDAQLLTGPVLGHLDDRLSEDPRSLRVVLVSRWDLPLSRLVPELLGDLTVLRGDLLRLDRDEVATLVAEQARTSSAEVAEAIYARARGWCAAVVLTARAVATSQDPVAAARRLTAGTTVVDQVATEVFAALSARERHVLLCVAPEEVVSPSLARHLSHDADAGRILDGLESTGLLVSRYVDARQVDMRLAGTDGGFDPDELEDAEPSYRLHPLLVELARRRLTAGGVDVERARAAVRRAVGLDLDQGILRHALRRLVSVGAHGAAIGLLREEGVALVLAGEAPEVGLLVRHHTADIENDPGCLFPVALQRWLAGDLGAAQHWLHRMDVLARTERSDGALSASVHLEHLCARLMLARLANESAEELVPETEAIVAGLVDAGSESPLRPVLRLELGVAHLHAGRFAQADRHLAGVLVNARTAGLSALSAEAGSQLALSQLLQGREHAVLQFADEARATDERQVHAPTVQGGLAVARDMARLQAVAQAGPDSGGALAGGPRTVALHPADALAGAVARMLTSRRLLLHGFVADAQRTLDSESVRADVPPVVRVPLLVEQGLEAALATDRDRLSRLEDELSRRGAGGEAAMIAALRADVVGDARAVTELCDTAAGTSTCAQPPVVALALVLRAQLVDSEGRRDAALADLREALTATEVRRNALPFLGWSRHGTPVPTLLRALAERSSSPWVDELLAALDGRGAIVAVAGPLTATPRERAHVPDGVMRPSLSPRERDVLHELARGATYADIAADLYVSENTVKTHVSSLYAKLAVSRRSDALAVARTLQLL
jgi:LuxR family maltose regulon positive regulatory protein